MMKIGVMGTSLKENEFRMPLHPEAIGDLADSTKADLVFEEGYGARWNISDSELREQSIQIATKGEIYNDMDATIIAKPMIEDLWNIPYGGTLIGWLHFTLCGRLASVAVERKQTVLTFEGINPSTDEFGRKINAFPDNGKLAGVAALHHLIAHEGLHPKFGQQDKICVIGHGNAGAAIVQEALDMGYQNVLCLSLRKAEDIKDRVSGCSYLQYRLVNGNQYCEVVTDTGSPIRMSEFLSDYKIIFNAVGQNPNQPVMYFGIDEIEQFNHRCFVVDVSCDPCMGFPFSRTTTFESPSYMVGDVKIYSVDHTPGYFWDAGSWVYTRGLSPWLSELLKGVNAWRQHPVLCHAIEIDEGHIRNESIVGYQSRDETWPFYTREPQPWRLTVDRNRVALKKKLIDRVMM